ncbi:MAG: nucleoside recognition domain-containing protein [Clostridium fessum]
MAWLTERADAALTAAGINRCVHSLLIDGVCNGVGSVLSFLPIVVTLFFFLSLLEDSGYMARVAFVMDKLLRKDRPFRTEHRADADWLSAARYQAVMASRTLSSERDRKMTILLTPFMSCSAKIIDLCVFYRCLFPASWGDCYDCTLSVGNPDGNFDGNAS